jgi:ABC-2 family transporter
MIIPKQFLFVDWEGGGNLSPALTVVRHLVAAGHHVRFLEEPCNQEEIEATGSAFVSYVQAPQRTTKAPVDDFVRDWDSRTPLAAFAWTRERLLFGPARACAQDVLTELQAHPAVALALNIILYGAMIAAEKAGVPTALLTWACFLLVVLATFPSLVETPQARASLVSLASSFSWLAEPIAIDTAGGYATFKIGFLILLIVIWPLLASSRMLRGEEERGSLDALLSLPRGRSQVALEKLAAVWTALLAMGLLIGLMTFAGGTSVSADLGLGDALLSGLNIPRIAQRGDLIQQRSGRGGSILASTCFCFSKLSSRCPSGSQSVGQPGRSPDRRRECVPHA